MAMTGRRKLLLVVTMLGAIALIVHSGYTLHRLLKPVAAKKADCLRIIAGTATADEKADTLQRLWGLMKVGDGECAAISAHLAGIMDGRERSGANYGKEFGVVLWSLKILEDFSLDTGHIAVVERVASYRPKKDDGDIGWKVIQQRALQAKMGITLRTGRRTLDEMHKKLETPAP